MTGGRPSDASLPTRVRITGMLGLAAIFAVCFAAIKAGLELAPPLRFGALRVIVAGVALLGVAAVRHEPLVPPRRIWPLLAALSALATTIAYGAMFLSPGRTGAGIASVLGNTQPLFAVVLAAYFLSEHMTTGKWLALILGTGGVALIAYPSLAGPGAYGLSGAVLALAVSASSASGAVIVKRMGPLPSLVTTTAWSLILGGVPLLLASAALERAEPVRWNAAFVGLLLFLALIGTAFASALWFWLVQRDDVGRLTMFLFLVPMFGLVIAALWFGEPVGLYEVAGLALIAGGILTAAGVSRGWCGRWFTVSTNRAGWLRRSP